jgi:adenylosuccinate lyase
MKTLILAFLIMTSRIFAGDINEANIHECYVSPLSGRYGSPEMKALFSNQTKFATWRKIWVALAEAQYELGLPIEAFQIAEMKAQIDNIDFALADQIEKKNHHDVMAHLQAYGIVCPFAKPIMHLGATSCVVTDNADAMIIRQGLKIIEGKLRALIEKLAEQADRYKDLPCLSYTHFQAAQPTTVGKRFAMWLQDFWMDYLELEYRQDRLHCLGLKGATGTQASFLELFKGDHFLVKDLEKRFARKIDFEKVFALSGQTYTRKQDMQVLAILADIAASAHKIGTDIRLLAHEKEIEEPFGEEQVGSTAMPYKRNPMMSERVCSLARHVFSLHSTLEYNVATQWLERTLDDSANRRIAIPESFLIIDYILDQLNKVVEHCVIHPRVIEKNLAEELPFMLTENILMVAVKNGSDRHEVHERLRKLTQIAGDAIKLEGRENPLFELIETDDIIALSQEQLHCIFNAKNLTGRASQQVEEFLNEVRSSMD